MTDVTGGLFNGKDDFDIELNASTDDNSGEELEGGEEGELQATTNDEHVVIEKNDRSLAEFHRWYNTGRLNIEPEWQRNYVWDNGRASRLIESFLSDIPVPVVYLAKTDDNKYEVIDGVQRLTSVFTFFAGKTSLTGLELLPELNKKYFKDLPEPLQDKLQDATLRTFEVSQRTSKNLLFIIFKRLNTGGVALSEMEIRNCVFGGRLNSLIKELANYDSFVKCVNQPGLQRRMNDRVLVLRFIAFYQMHYTKVQAGLKMFLNEFFDTYRNPSDKKLEEYTKTFKHAMRAAFTVFGDQGFRLRRIYSKGGSEWATRVNAPVFQVIGVSLTQYDYGQITSRADAIYEEYLDLITSDTEWLDCVRRATAETNRLKYAFQTWNERLAVVMAGAESNDKQRTFTRKLKQEMFDDDKSCAICNNQIKSINDAALDHDLHYWRGGKTVPDNARLVHRICNLKRSKNATA